ncbi:MAG TPA: hypothetical protein DDX40_00515 [Rikenellaceae bacterium]|nr:hypothetical protein [Rikenellaceae bacterium]
MSEETTDTAAKILKAAEEEFMEKGYGNAKMMSIAARAGVSHSMLHYYYRSKEKMFRMIFDEKARLIVSILEGISGKGLGFKEIITQFVKNQFNLMMENDRFVCFMIDEIIHNEENVTKVIDIVKPKLTEYLRWFNEELDKEIKTGNIKRIAARDLIMNIVSLNASTFMYVPVLKKLEPEINVDEYLEGRRNANAEFVWNAIKNDKNQ